MATTIKQLEQALLKLSKQERAYLADRLLSSLDGEVLSEVDAAWVAEAEIRFEEYKSGKRQVVSAQDVFTEADRVMK
ncbi:MAG: addiction module protein [Desulfobulbaceae bacterium]|jgi:putative addiction module component (TIGR02574 family)